MAINDVDKLTAQNRLPSIINDFTITISTINGSGSATANTSLLRALFKMGIPVSGKNIFPSNIKGQPTWYTLRVSKMGYLGRLEQDDIVVAMNPETIENEQTYIQPSGVLLFADYIDIKVLRDDIVCYELPVNKVVKDAQVVPKLREYLGNMVYVGVLARLLGIDLDKLRLALDIHFKGQKGAVDANMKIILASFNWAETNLKKVDRYYVEPMDSTRGKIMSDGNTAAALGSIFGGVQFTAWYPITPATSLAENLNEYVPVLRTDPIEEGKVTSVVIQAEDELAAIGMAVGAGWAGLRAMTSTSGPGLSLMAEYLGLAYFAEIPVVVWDVQRVGPSTGLPTRTAQADLVAAFFLSHGDTQYIILLPGSVKECFEFAWRAFDFAERFQTPVIILSDLDLGMNQWISDPFEYPNKPMDRGKILWEVDFENFLKKHNNKWGRYQDVDGDGIPYRTLPGNLHPLSAYFTRGTGHDEYGHYSENPDVWESNQKRLAKKIFTSRSVLPKPLITREEPAKFSIISYGSSDFPVLEARDIFSQMGIGIDYLRVRSIPFSDEIKQFAENHERIYVVEGNQFGQMRRLLTLNMPSLAERFVSICHTDGLALSAQWICDSILREEDKRNDR